MKFDFRFIAVFAAGVSALVGIVLWTQLDYEARIDTQRGYSLRATRNSLLAAELLLRRFGYTTHSVARLPDPAILDRYALLVLSQPGSRASVDALLHWVSEGGVLYTTTQALNPFVNEPMLDALDIQSKSLNKLSRRDVEITFAEQKFQLQMQGSVQFSSTSPIGTNMVAQAALYIQAYQVDQGILIISTDPTLFSNARLGHADHGRFLHSLAASTGPDATVWLQYSPANASLLAVLWQYAWPFLFAITLTIAGIIWLGGRRFGPALQPVSGVKRSLMEHLQASGRFYTRRGRHNWLASAARQKTMRQLATRFPGLNQLPPAEQVTTLAAHTGLKEAQIGLALHTPAKTERELSIIVRLLQHIETRV